MKAVYVGAGTDTKPFAFFPSIKKWILIDSLPNNEYGDFYDPRYDFSRPNFIKNLDSNMLSVNFVLEKIYGDKNNIRLYKNDKTDQTVIYHTNTPLPSSFDSTSNPAYQDTLDWNVICVMGHHPYDCIMKTASKDSLTFIGITTTCYWTYDEDNQNSVINAIENNNLGAERFVSFECIVKDRVVKTNNWKDFLELKKIN